MKIKKHVFFMSLAALTLLFSINSDAAQQPEPASPQQKDWEAKYKASETKRKQQKQQFAQNSKNTFQSTYAAAAAGTKTDEAQAQYFEQQAKYAENKTIYHVAATLSRDYIAPVVQPVITEARQYIYKTEHEKRMEDRERYEQEQIVQSTKTQKASELNSKINTLVTLHQTSQDPKSKEMIKKAINNLEKTLDELFGDSNDSKSQDSSTEEQKSDQKNDASSNKDIENKESKKGLITRLCSFVCPAFVISGIDVAAQTCGTKALAESLSSSFSSFVGKEQAISRALVVTGTAAICVAVYKTYQAFTADEEEEEAASDEFDFLKR